jgi:hypothetical protein
MRMDTQIYPAKEDCPKILSTKRESRGRKEKKKENNFSDNPFMKAQHAAPRKKEDAVRNPMTW